MRHARDEELCVDGTVVEEGEGAVQDLAKVVRPKVHLLHQRATVGLQELEFLRGGGRGAALRG